jgi:transcriptional regulator with XRE-family HTH domain
MRHNRAEVSNLAKAMDVSENTIYRWMNGSTEPRANHLKKLPEVLSEQRSNITYAINQTFPGILTAHPSHLREVQKDIYRRVLDLIAINNDDETCFWQISQAVFEYALLHLDTEHKGICITFAKLMPLQEDQLVHSLREFAIRGSPPWLYTSEIKGFLGGTTLAGNAVSMQRPLIWSDAQKSMRLPVEVDEFEHSAYAAPLVRGNRVAGVLIVSSTQSTFFQDPGRCEAVIEYAQLLTIGLHPHEFQPISKLHLRPMPPLKVQRDHLSQSYVNDVLKHIRAQNVSRKEAEEHIQGEMEKKFEEMARNMATQRNNSLFENRNKQIY